MNDKFFNSLVVVWCTTLTISIFCTVIFFPYSYLNVLRDRIESNKNESVSIRNSLNQLNNEIGMLKIKINSLTREK